MYCIYLKVIHGGVAQEKRKHRSRNRTKGRYIITWSKCALDLFKYITNGHSPKKINSYEDILISKQGG